MEIHQLRYFVAVAEAGSFRKASDICHVTQPSLSQQIMKLEAEMKQQLFDRLGRGIALTEAGRGLLPRARQILMEVDEAAEEVRRDVDQGRGALAVGVLPTIAPFLLPPVLRKFLAAYPECRLSILEDFTERLLEAVEENRLDCAFTSAPIEHDLVDVEILGSERMLALVPEGHALQEKQSIRFGDLHGYPLVVMHEMHCLGRQIQGFCVEQRLTRQIVCRGAQVAMVQNMVRLGMGVSIVPAMCACAAPEPGCRYIQLDETEACREIAVVWRHGRLRSQPAKRFVELVRSQLMDQNGALSTFASKFEPN